MMTGRLTIAILLIYAAISVYIGFFADDRMYYIGAQLNECLLLLCIAINTIDFARTLAITLLILAMFEFVDEIAGRNTSVYWNDYLPITIAASYLLWKLLKKK